MTKAELRKAAIGQRKDLSEAEVEALSLLLLERFARFDFSEIKTIHVFLPIEEKKEPDTFLLIDWIKINFPAVKIIVPRADFDTALMTHHYYTGKKDLQKNLFNILEPQSSDVYSGTIDLVLVPLLAFDKRGYRVGYGKGFYDRFLRGLETQKIGLSFFEAQELIDDADEYDIKLDQCITPRKIYNFSL